ncbi:6-phosphogluconate phosphatase [Vibrio sp.]|uniref:6-phosphogluconate phosphatase n=1 Tax=Vibrio sp. TaxID=678 RepID=UPI003AA8AD71
MDTDKIKCVIFDCDGTLVDSERLCCQALVNVFASYGADISFEQCMNNFQGGKMFDILKDTSQAAGLSIPMEVLEPKYREQVKQLFDEQLQPIPHAKQTVEYLTQKGIAVCVASNGPQSKMQHSLALTGMLPIFENKIFSAFDINSWKPDPDLLLFAVMQMGFLLEECMFVDDTENGVYAGINAGLKTIYYSPVGSNIDAPQVTTVKCLTELQRWFS